MSTAKKKTRDARALASSVSSLGQLLYQSINQVPMLWMGTTVICREGYHYAFFYMFIMFGVSSYQCDSRLLASGRRGRAAAAGLVPAGGDLPP